MSAPRNSSTRTAMASTPISRLMESWSDSYLTTEVDVRQSQEPTPTVWPLQKVKEKFEEQSPDGNAIACPCLTTSRMSVWDMEISVERNGPEFDSLKYQAIGQKGSALLHEYSKFMQIPQPIQGSLLVASLGTVSEEEGRSKRSIAEREGTALHVPWGHALLLPAGTLFSIYFFQDALIDRASVIRQGAGAPSVTKAMVVRYPEEIQ